jgi:hypothetical protein
MARDSLHALPRWIADKQEGVVENEGGEAHTAASLPPAALAAVGEGVRALVGAYRAAEAARARLGGGFGAAPVSAAAAAALASIVQEVREVAAATFDALGAEAE